MSEENPGGRIFFSSAGRSMVEENEITLTSVGVDIGSATSHLAFSRLTLEQRHARYVVRSREMLHESDILLTPYADGAPDAGGETIDADALGAFIAAQYAAAGLKRDEIDTGALILTGVAVRRANARAIGELFAVEAGRFVAVSAGDSLETVMAAFGSGAVARSAETGQCVVNIDIGGGTSKIAICKDGKVTSLTAIDIGARLVVVDDDHRVVRIEEAGSRFAAEAGVALAMGAPLDEADLRAMAARMADRLMDCLTPGPLAAETDALLRLPPLTGQAGIEAISFSGGVSEFIYGYAGTDAHFGDLGPYLAAEIRARIEAAGLTLEPPAQSIRATVIGASQYTIQVSGSTIFVSPAETLPLRNVPVIAPAFDFTGEALDADEIAAATSAALARMELAGGDRPVALCYAFQGSATFARVDAFLTGALRAMAPVIDSGHPLVLVSDGDIGGVVGIHCREEMGLDLAVISIDGIALNEFDYIDIGALIPASGAVPVVIKSLVFPTTTALGRAGAAG
jgi:ethanolamine utilization protein EutA